ncbi:MAG: hypothetical protein JWR75_328 [Devosia sp.]|nr:hypothetical protein [Devosia sp.]
MQVGTIIAIYFVVWWISLFVILPLGARSQRDAGQVVAGSEPGAPARLRLWQQLLATTLLAAVVTALLFWGLSSAFIQEYWR